jgi:Spy/CpxP family protein refolding chaperone
MALHVPAARLALAAVILLAAACARAQTPQLTDAQKKMLAAAEDDLNAKVAPLAAKAGQAAAALDRALLAEKPDPQAERKLGEEFADAVSQVALTAVRIRVASLHDIAATLTPAQKKLLLSELDKPGADPDLLALMKRVFLDQK